MSHTNNESTTGRSPNTGVGPDEGRLARGMQRVLVLDDRDNVATCMAEMKPGDTVEVTALKERRSISFCDAIPFGHKASLCDLDAGDGIVKFLDPLADLFVHGSDNVHVRHPVLTNLWCVWIVRRKVDRSRITAWSVGDQSTLS